MYMLPFVAQVRFPCGMPRARHSQPFGAVRCLLDELALRVIQRSGSFSGIPSGILSFLFFPLSGRGDPPEEGTPTWHAHAPRTATKPWCCGMLWMCPMSVHPRASLISLDGIPEI
ncbi:hypothetical protein PISMIDRAFT_531710 [Pisolithus microcarpus 441]|uniref:Unplaced genomic scaffold scaffold_61, whole genome shotgun sequence n=1 Tax=Pisolithus microcarpus 441 TaxID=765257 RepID=A0A0C9ZHE7_9AGAM|nr:hypothetical protein PISMIDRAFT_531710 [Pisolithus microcarpus 441]